MITLKSLAEVEAMARAGAIIARLHDALPQVIKPDTTTEEIDRFAEDMIRSHPGAEPAFKGLYGFPGSACVSINDEVVHGIPREDRVLRDGDIVSVDVGVRLEGWYGDAARTFAVGDIDDDTQRLLDVTREALRQGIQQALPGNRLGDIGHAIQNTAEPEGYSIVRDLVGHGIGREPHEDPQVPNFGDRGQGVKLRAGMVLAIEPMVNDDGAEVRTLDDRWTVVTVDGCRSAHFEHTVAILDDGPRVLTSLSGKT